MLRPNNKFYTAKTDAVFKAIIEDEYDPEFLKEFLSRILNESIESVEMLKNELSITRPNEKNKTVDLLVKTKDEYIHLELNGTNYDYLHMRNLAYFSSIVATSTDKGDDYDINTKYIHIDLTYNLNINKYQKDYYEYYVMTKDEEKYVENYKIIEFNMSKIMNYWYNKDEAMIKKYNFLIMLDLSYKDLRKLSKGDKFIMEFDKKIENLNEQETFRSLMTWEEDQRKIQNTEKKRAFNKGLEEGIQEGSLNMQKEIIKNMLDKGLTKDKIASYLALDINDLEKIINEI